MENITKGKTIRDKFDGFSSVAITKKDTFRRLFGPRLNISYTISMHTTVFANEQN